MAHRVSADVVPSAPVTPAMARVLIDQARAGRYTHGVLGLRSRPGATPEVSFTHRDQPVRIVPAGSALAVREAVRGAMRDGWLVVVTDRSEDDLGPGLLARFTWQRLRHADPWQAVQQRFSAQTIDARLLRLAHAREVASGLLELAPADGWPPAPAGVLTRDHALGCLARAELGVGTGPLDLIAVLQWSTNPGLPGMVARLRGRAGEQTVDATLAWIADAAGEAGPFVAALLRTGAPTDLVPLGIVLDCLLGSRRTQEAEVALARLQHRWGDVPRTALAATGRLAVVTVSGLLDGRATVADAHRLLARADDLLGEAGADALAETSSVLRAGLTLRLRALAEQLRRDDPDALESAWRRVEDHLLADEDPRVAPALAGVRLARWLRTPDEPHDRGLAASAAAHLDTDAWVDSAVNDAEAGVDDPVLAGALEQVLQRVQARRDAHDLAFAAALAREGGAEALAGVLPIEQVLPDIVLPLTRSHPTLLLVLDGMSAGVATEIIADAVEKLDYGLVECLVPGATRRTPVISVLPSVTEMSRASLLSGRLARGQQDVERRNFTEFARAHGLGDAPLFHKRGLDTGRGGFAVADEVRLAIGDTDRYRLVGCVLNTIDDALDRTDPGGTDWTADTVKHLAPLLRAARSAGRLIVLTSDHGHVVERRRGTQRGVGLGGRYRAAADAVADDEVLVSGPRVLTPEHRAVLAVNERLRYGPLKAGYHGGAAPAEVVVPVVLLAPSTLDHHLVAAPVAQPDWWETTGIVVPASAVPIPEPVPATPQPDLFSTEPEPAPSAVAGLGAALIGSPTYQAQRRLAGRVAVTDRDVAGLVDALAGAPDRRLSAARAAAQLGEPVARLRFAMSQVTKLLNVEGYPVVSTDPATQAVSLDVGLLAEQYGVRA